MTGAALLRSRVQTQPISWFKSPRNTPTDRRKNARMTILVGIATVFAAHFWLAFVVENTHPEWRDPEYFHRENRLRAVALQRTGHTPTRPLVVAIGGSRPQIGLIPEHLGLGDGPGDPIVFDCVQSGAIPIGERLNLARLFASGITPDFVLIEVLPPVLADPGPMDNRIPIQRMGSTDLTQIDRYHDRPNLVRIEWARARANSLFTLRGTLTAHWGISELFPSGVDKPDALWADMQTFGSSPMSPKTWSPARRAAGLAVAAKTYRWLLNDFRINPTNDRIFRDMLDDCRKRGIRAALFTMPESPTFRGWYSSSTREVVTSYLAKLSRDYEVPIFDASAWEEDETAFLDGHHLFGSAAEKFSKRFGRDCIGPWVRGTIVLR